MRRTLVALVLAAPFANAESLAARVNRAIERGVANLRTLQREDGSFRSEHHEHYPGGATALAVYALAKSGVAPDDPALARAVTYLRNQPPGRVYGVAAVILALDALPEGGHRARIHELAAWLEAQLHPRDRIWAYGPATHLDPDHTDLSNTQMAILGLWAAERRGYEVAPRIWREMVRRVPRFATKGGGFGYRVGDKPTGSMTTAGITVLTLALARLPETERRRASGRRAEEAVTAGWEYLDRVFAVKGNPIGPAALQTAWHYYYLYGIERVAALGDRREIGGKDWYREGARYLVDAQDEKGSWGDLEETSFALLFLRRSTFTQIGKPKAALTGEEKAPEGPAAPDARVPFLRRWLVLGPFDDPDDTRLEEPVIREDKASPWEGRKERGLKWVAHRQPQAPYDLELPTVAADRSLTYAFTYLHVASACDAVLWFGHDDGAHLYLDGRAIYASHLQASAKRDAAPVPVRLEAGVRRLLVKVQDKDGFTGFFLRLCDPQGRQLAGVVPSLSSRDAQTAEAAWAQPGLFTPSELLALLPRDSKLALQFRRASDLDRVACEHHQDKLPVWFDRETARGDIQPHPGGRGMLLLHGFDQEVPGRLYRKVVVPRGRSRLVARVSSEAKATQGRANTRVRLLVFDGTMHTLADEVVRGWSTVAGDLTPFAGREVLVILESAWADDWYYDHVFLDEFSVVR